MARRTAAWMQQLDERILDHLNEKSWSSPRVMASQPEFRWTSQRRLRERCQMLLYAEFVAPIAGEMVEITTWGQLYLEGDLDAAHQPRPIAQRVSP